ncbi:gamma-glutamyltransferase [soil metagenome]
MRVRSIGGSTILLALLGFVSSRPIAQAEVFEKQVVVSQESHASDVGRDILRQGGNAIDAAVATAFALAVTHPAAGNIGGGGFIVAYLAEPGEVVTFDFRERAPLTSTAEMYLREDGRLDPRHRAGAWAAGVPGTVRGLGLAHEKHGQLPWADLVRPAVRLAREGFPVSETLARSLNSQLHVPDDQDIIADGSGRGSRLADFPESLAAFGKADGTTWSVGDRLFQPDLAETLQRIAEQGPDEFYTGETARRIAAYMEAHQGQITLEDLAAYEAKVRPAVSARFRGLDVYGMGPPSSGGVVVLLMLKILERYDLKADGPDHPETLHRITEAMRRAFFIRATEIADPDYVAVPVDRLLSAPFVNELAETITERATPSQDLAPFPIAGLAEGEQTTHLSTLDAEGNAVALTYTLEQGYGSKAVVAGAGFLLNNEMGDFNLIPAYTDNLGRIGTPANRIEPGKRMLSSMSPTIALDAGKVRLVTGSPGGRTIPNTVLWVVLNVLEFDLEPRSAVEGLRTHHAWFPDLLMLEGRRDEATLQALQARGHLTGRLSLQGDAHTIVIEPTTGRIHGVADPRRATSKASGD